MDAEKLKRELFSLLTKKGAKLMGVADLSRIVDGVMRTGVSVAVPVPKNIVKDLQTAPTKEYYDAYYALKRHAGRYRHMWGRIFAGKGI